MSNESQLSNEETLENIKTHLEMMMNDDMKDCACYREEDSLDMKIFRILQGFSRKIEEVKDIKQLVEQDIPYHVKMECKSMLNDSQTLYEKLDIILSKSDSVMSSYNNDDSSCNDGGW